MADTTEKPLSKFSEDEHDLFFKVITEHIDDIKREIPNPGTNNKKFDRVIPSFLRKTCPKIHAVLGSYLLHLQKEHLNKIRNGFQDFFFF